MTQAPPGWYPDPTPPPGTPPALRWWDGATWTGHTQAPYAVPRLAAAGPTTPDGEPLAGWWWRVLALVTDAVVTGLVTLLVTLPTQIAVQRELWDLQEDYQRRLRDGGPAGFGDLWRDQLEVYADHWLGLLVLPMLIALAYHATFLRWKGATPGKLVCGLRVRRTGRGGPPGWGSVAARVVVQFLVPWLAYLVPLAVGSLPLLVLMSFAMLGYLLLDVLWATGQRRRALHDLAADTVVVTTRR